MEFRNNINVGEVYIVIEEELLSDFTEEGFRNFDSKTIEEEMDS